MKAAAVTHGAISIVNAIASGRGAALGIDLKVKATVSITNDTNRIVVKGKSAQIDAGRLPRLTIEHVLRRYQVNGCGAEVEVTSEIPPSRGLKSSSAVSNAVALATMAALGREIDDIEAINMAVNASIKAGVTITGALDDATASYFGGIVLTDNRSRAVLRRVRAPRTFEVLLLIPEQELSKKNIDVKQLRRFSDVVDQIFRLALDGKYWNAITLNGILHACLLGFSTEPITNAISNGALAAGLSGTGPAYAAICWAEKMKPVTSGWSIFPGRMVRARVNNQKARVVASV